ncbi:MAG: sialate O-acetylesterase [Cyanobacteria bacterium P01_D01_bin.14]
MAADDNFWRFRRSALGCLLSLSIGIVLQKYFNVSGYVGDGLRAVGLYQYVYGPAQALKSATTAQPIPSERQGQLRLYVLMGQSNMSGLAPMPSSSAAAASKNVYTFGNDYQWGPAAEPVDSPVGQIDAVSLDESAGFGPSVAFAEALPQEDGAIGLIPCAKGGSSIAQWQRDLSDQSLYGSCLKRIRAASVMGQLEGVLFFQGEADAIDPTLYPSMQPQADRWGQQFTQMVRDLRQDLNQPDLPVVYAQIGADPQDQTLPNWERVRQQQQQIDVPDSARIQTDDLETWDGVHFTADSYRIIGQRFATAWGEIAP